VWLAVVQLFNVIQKAQAAKASEEEGKLSLRGSGKPTLGAPKMHARKKKKDLIPTQKEGQKEYSAARQHLIAL